MNVAAGTRVLYVSSSGRRYDAVVDAIPENPWHEYTKLPTVALSFRNERGKLVRKARVLPSELPEPRPERWSFPGVVPS